MESTQKLVLERLEDRIKKAGFIPSIQYSYTNRGNISVHADNLDIRYTIHFDFQTGYFSLTIYEGQKVRGKDHIVWESTIDGTPIPTALDRIMGVVNGKVPS